MCVGLCGGALIQNTFLKNYFLCACVCVWYANVCVAAHTCDYIQKPEENISCSFYHTIPYAQDRVRSLNLDLAVLDYASKPHHPPVVFSSSTIAGVTGAQDRSKLLYGCLGSKLRAHAYAAAIAPVH